LRIASAMVVSPSGRRGHGTPSGQRDPGGWMKATANRQGTGISGWSALRPTWASPASSPMHE
jgi:hypothetical protein